MVSIVLLVVAVGVVGYLLHSLLGIVRTCVQVLNSTITEFRLERELLGLQKQMLTNINTQISLQRVAIEKQLDLAMNSITVMRLLQDKTQDPGWMHKFDEGRDNAKFN